jgi:acetylornithine deacetylase/succinyl-diaminopimelate desuccinylase-like protein
LSLSLSSSHLNYTRFLSSFLSTLSGEDHYPPFDAVIDSGKIYGRGSEDAKSLVSTGLMSLIVLQRAGVTLGGKVTFLAAADEEAGGKYGIAWLTKNHPERIRATWALNEGGGNPIERDGALGYLLACGEKGRFEANVTCQGRSGHAANPWFAQNALHSLGQLLGGIRSYRPEVDVSHSIFDYLDWFGIPIDVTPADLDSVLEEYEVERPMANILKAVSRMSVVPTMVEAGVKSNSIPGSAHLTCDIRTLPFQDKEYVVGELAEVMADIPHIQVEFEETATANSSPVSTVFVDRLRQAMQIVLGRDDLELIPTLTVGFTDSRCVRPLGTNVYGFAPLVPGADLLNRGVHGADEFIEVDTLQLRTRLYTVLAYLLLATTH